jgi:roadblock/LC7 domain-containing protein
MSYTQTQLDALQAALASGTLRVTYDGKTVEYRSVDELSKAIKIVQSALQGAGTTRVTHMHPAYSKGT